MPENKDLVTTLEQYNYFTILFDDEKPDIIMTNMSNEAFSTTYRKIESQIINPSKTDTIRDGTISDCLIDDIREQGLFAELLVTTEQYSWA